MNSKSRAKDRVAKMVARKATRQAKGDDREGEKDEEVVVVVSDADAKLAALVEELDVEGPDQNQASMHTKEDFINMCLSCLLQLSWNSFLSKNKFIVLTCFYLIHVQLNLDARC